MKNSLLLLFMCFTSALHAHVVSDEVLAEWGYESNPHKKYLNDFCVGSVAPISADYQGIRAIRKPQNLSELRHRFTLGQVVYQSEDAAQTAVDAINNPARRSSKHAKMCDLRQAFNMAQVLYFVHTDVGKFSSEINVMLGMLKQQVQQTE